MGSDVTPEETMTLNRTETMGAGGEHSFSDVTQGRNDDSASTALLYNTPTPMVTAH